LYDKVKDFILIKKLPPLKMIRNTTYKNLLVEDSKLGVQIVTINDEPQQGRLYLEIITTN
jgi:hypothetical protein